jgi:hypothetical protein
MSGADQPSQRILEPDPVIEAYKKDVDRTLLRENLKLTPDERLRKLQAFMRSVEEVRAAATANRS